MSMLKVQYINTGYGKKQVLFDVNLVVEEGETVLLIGSNGSGKSTLCKAAFGMLPLWSGEVYFDGELLHNSKRKTKSSKLIPEGLMYVPQKNELFEDMTVEKNLEMALLHMNNKKEANKRVQEVFDQNDILAKNKMQVASRLSGGERKLLSLGMVLTNRPKMVLYDEPLAGLSGNNVSIVLKWLQAINENGTTLVIIEHRIKELMVYADKVVGLKLGQSSNATLDNLERIKSFMI